MEKIVIFEEKYSSENIKEILEIKGLVLKDSDRSFVKVIDYKGEKLIVKKPVDKNRRKWERIMSVFRDGEGLRVLKTMEILNKNGICSNLPIALIEYRKNSMIVDSYIIYTYIEGNNIVADDAEKVIELIKKIHKTGYLHSDTQVRNFLNSNGEILTIDAKLKKKLLGKISENLEYIGFAVDIKEGYNYINTKSLWFIIAKIIYESFRLKRRVRQYFKNRKKLCK